MSCVINPRGAINHTFNIRETVFVDFTRIGIRLNNNFWVNERLAHLLYMLDEQTFGE